MGKLFIIPTPIGNLDDITLRAIKTLKEVDYILAEDTRHSGKLLKHLDIKKRMVAHHMHNEHHTAENLVEAIKSGDVIGLITDAGTPIISDPGFSLAKACVDAGVEVECLPGPTALIPALVNSGLPADKFCFEGFLPVKKGRQTRLKFLAEETRTMVFYESPHRLIKSLTQFIEYFGEERKACVCRELSKLYEEKVTDTLPNLLAHFEVKKVKGEIVLVVEGKKNS
ncbi:MAG: 16S rRNA (cytidine(1402)-2'-O)-methyltransferase [Flavobacteriales bacterium]|nr:16S rRNA (cytidine(1402)-2'-O)-methyltransferase [Flavobacteriales bacterium]